MKKSLLSILLIIVLVVGMIPTYVRADDTDINSSQSGDYGSFIDGNHVISDMIEKNGKNVHPRLIMSEEKFSNLKSHIGDGSLTATVLGMLRSQANNILSEEFEKYKLEPDDHLVETSKRIQRRVATLAMAYNIFGDEKYAKRCYEELEAACNFPDWSPVHFLDTAEMCTAFAYGYDWLYNWMTPEQRTLLRTNMIEKGLNQVMEEYNGTLDDSARTYFWYSKQMGDNWQFVCTGGTNLAALAIGDEPDAKEVAANVLTHGFRKAYYAVREGYSKIDGTYIEGLGYWDYATYYLGLQSSALKSATGTDYGLTNHEGIIKSVDFIRYMSSNVPLSFSFGDDGDSRNTGWAAFLWLGEHFNSPEMAAVRLRKLAQNPDYNYLDLLWIDESKQTGMETNKDTDWGSVGACNASFRNTWDQSGLVAAIHAGENNYKYHGHYDLGSFYIESNGTRFFTDLGNENYSLEGREKSYRIKAEGHNTLVINPTDDIDQCNGVTCLITDYNSGNEAYAVTDLTKAYNQSGANSVIRGLKMIKDEECVIIHDEIALNNPGDIYWFAHTKGDIDVADNGKSAVITVDSERLWVGLISNEGQFTSMEAMPLNSLNIVEGAADNSAYRKLAIHLANTKNASISVACIPLKSGENTPSWIPTHKSFADWSLDAEKNHEFLDQGNGEHKCKTCGIQEKHNAAEAMNKKDATCIDKGYTGDILCKDCGAVIEAGKDIEASGHVWDEGTITKEPSVEAAGEKTFKCIKCGETKVEATDKLLDNPEQDAGILDIPEISVKGKFNVASAILLVADKNPGANEVTSGNKKPVAYAITSGNKKAAKLSKKGILTARKPGEIEITAYADKKKKEEIGKIKIIIKNTKVPSKDKICYMDEILDLKSKITDLPLGENVEFVISKKQQKYAMVDSKTGILKPLKDGKLKVTVLIGEGKMAARFYITVSIKTPKLSPSKMVEITAGMTKTICIKNIKSDAKIKWSVSDENVAKIVADNNSGKIKLEGLKAGKITLTADIDGHIITKEIEIRE